MTSDIRIEALARATAGLEPPYAVIDLDAFDANAAAMAARSGGTPIRAASKSIRCRSLLARALAVDGWRGVLAFTLPEALWLARDHDDVVVGYPTVDRPALAALAADPDLAARVTVMVDSVAHLDLLDLVASSMPSQGTRIRVAIDVDASLRLLRGAVHLGPRRSPVHTPAEAATLAHAVVDRPGLRLVGLMSYEGQIAGLGDDPPGPPVRRRAVRAVQAVSTRELRRRRAAVVAAVREVADLEFVNGGGTGSLESTASEPAVTELGAGSGLYSPALFDTYRRFRHQPAAYAVLSVARVPGPGIATVLGGGWVASGPAGPDRLPTPVWPTGLRLLPAEGAGEVQTPLSGASDLSVGDRVWFRHAKAGELCERVDVLHLVSGEEVVDAVATYRGEGHAFL